jgi:hypothetical protein
MTIKTKKPPAIADGFFFICNILREKSDSSYNFSASQATRANMDCLGRTVNNSLYSFDVGLPSTV